MISEQPATHSPTRSGGVTNLVRAPFAASAGVADITGMQRRKRLQVASEQTTTVAPWMKVGRIVAWVCLIVVIDVAVGHTLQLTAENFAIRVQASEPAQSADLVSAAVACPALDRYVHRTTSIDELHDLQDQLCPTLSEPQQTGN